MMLGVLVLLVLLALGAANMEYFSLFCHKGYRLHTTNVDRTYQGLSLLRCVQSCDRQAASQPWMAGQCKAISFLPSADGGGGGGGQCVFSPLRLFNPRDVDVADGWTVCTQKKVLFGYALNGTPYQIPVSDAVSVCAGLGDSRIATFQELQYAWNHGWTYCALARVSNGSLVMLGNPQCKHPGFNAWTDPNFDANVFCVGSRAEIAIHENQRSFAFGFAP